MNCVQVSADEMLKR